ncbi:MAG TPA: c-type cytochrome [bacterium]|nr:c-type cytochrome [bacterium]
MKKYFVPLLLAGALAALVQGRAIMDLNPGLSPTPTATPEDPKVVQGRRLYTQLNCSYCHRIQGVGGRVGPALDNVGFRRVPEWLFAHFREPQKTVADSKMVQIPISDQQALALTAYLRTLGGRTFSPEAPVLFKEHCSSCHSMEPGNGDHPLELGAEGRYRDLDFIRNYIRNPRKMNPKALMKPYEKVLTQAQVHDLAVYIFHGGQ